MSRRNTAIVAVAVAIAAALVIWWVRRGGGPSDDAIVESGSGSGGSGMRGPRADRSQRTGDMDLGRVMIDDDPKGTLRLEGQVIDASDHPVKGATVVLSANPPRTTVTEDDGAFHFDALIGRPYTLVARAPGGIAGPVTARLTAKSDPIVLKLRPGAKLTVTVTAGGKPIDATVELRGQDEQRLEAKGGTAVFAPIAPGGYQIAAWAEGMARTFQWVGVSSGETEAKVSLTPGAGVKGRVVDEKGTGVSGARVRYSGASDWSQQGNDRLDSVTSGTDGAFELPALPAGTFRFLATHEEHAPGSSTLVTLDGKSVHTGVTIQLASGAVVSGKVVDSVGKPVVSARVRIAPVTDRRAMVFDTPRQAYTDAAGAFAIKGLPRKPLNAIALHESGSSDVKEVDATGGNVTNVTLAIDVTGTISGIVVDPQGHPIEGAQVTAGPTFDDNRTRVDMSQWRLRGFPQELTDGSGKFTLAGLAPGKYTITASNTARRSRRGPGIGDGVTASTGDNNVKVVLAPEGSVKGKVAFADGSAPAAYSISIGIQGGQPFTGGEFLVDGLPPQKYQLTIRGPSFQTRVVEVVIEAGKVADIGTVTVVKGRVIGGTVLADGKPVPGAQVHIGRMVFGNGTSSNAQFGPMGQGTKHDTTDANGAFVLSGFPDGDITIVAEHESIGRSKALRLPTVQPGQHELVLNLEKFGSLAGVLRQGDKPAEGVIVSCQSTTTPGAIFSVSSGPDGTYRLDRLAPDTYKVSAMLGFPMVGMKFYSKEVVVPSGRQVTVDLAVEAGAVTLDATVTARNGKLGVAQANLANGLIVATTFNELGLKLAANGAGSSQFVIIRNGEPARFSELVPGQYTICIVPYPAEVKGMAAMGYVERHGDTLNAFCKPVTVAPSPNSQATSLAVDLPAFVPDTPPPGPGPGSGSGSGS